MAREELLQWKPGKETPSDWMKETIRQMEYQYPYKDAQQMKLKFTVSELKKRDYLEEEAGEILVEEKEVVPLIPEFMQEVLPDSVAHPGEVLIISFWNCWIIGRRIRWIS